MMKKYPLIFVLDNVMNPLNIGMIYRSADILGVSEMFLCGRAAQDISKRIRRTARGAEVHIATRQFEQVTDAIQALKAEGYSIICMEITDKNQSINDFDFTRFDKIALVGGAEDRGVSPQLLEAADAHILIPMNGFSTSMNVAISMGIGGFEITRQWQKRLISKFFSKKA